MFLNIILLFQAEVEGLERDSVATQSFLDIVLESGTIGIIIVLLQLVLSAIGLYIFIERYLNIRKAAQIDDHL